MTSRTLTAAIAALTLFGAAAPAIDASAQDHHGGGEHHGGGGGGGGDHHGGGGGGGFGGGYHGGGGYGGGYHGGGGYGGGYRDGGDGGVLAGLALGAALGYYAGHPYYCREHRHWRWSRRYHHYVYYDGGYC
jgi:hypothetical protein